MIWFNDPLELIKQDKLTSFWPSRQQTFDERINSSSRFIIYSSLVAYGFKKDIRILVLGVLVLLAMYILYRMSPAFLNVPFNKNDPMGNFTESKLFDKDNSDRVMRSVFPDDVRNAERNFFTMPVDDIEPILQANGRSVMNCKSDQSMCNLESHSRFPGLPSMRTTATGVNFLDRM